MIRRVGAGGGQAVASKAGGYTKLACQRPSGFRSDGASARGGAAAESSHHRRADRPVNRPAFPIGRDRVGFATASLRGSLEDVLRLVNLDGRVGLDMAGRFVDLAQHSDNRFSPDPMAVFSEWEAIRRFASEQTVDAAGPLIEPARLGPPVPRPTQVFAIGLNYRDHAEEAKLPIPDVPMVFTKFPTCLAGPTADIPLTGDRVDWEVEQVVVIGKQARHVSAAEAWDVVAGFCVGQDVSDRRLQFAGKPPQFSLGKSAEAFGPFGPALVSLDEFSDPDALSLRCWVDGELMQASTTENLIFSVPELIEYISRYCVLEPGDLIFTGTPGGVGSVREPRRYLAPGELVESEIEGIGRLSNRCVGLD